MASPMDRIAAEVCAERAVTLDELRGPGRFTEYVAARVRWAQRVRAETRYSLTQMGRWLGGRDHTTIVHMLQNAETIEARWQRQSSDLRKLDFNRWYRNKLQRAAA